MKKYSVEKHLREFSEASGQELGNTLGTVLGELDYALHSDRPEVRERSMLVALAAVERAIAVSRNLRYYSLHTRLQIGSSDLTSTLLDTVDLVERELEHRKIHISVRAESGLVMNFDAAAMQQAILNVLIHVAHSMPQGGKINILLRHLKDTVEIELRGDQDMSGLEDGDPIFTPHHGPQRDGLGVNVSKALIESHGGEIRMPNKQSFLLSIPFAGVKKGKIPKETRRFRRVHVTLPATLLISPEVEITTEIKILSLGGCFVRLQPSKNIELPKVNDPIGLKIHYFNADTIAIRSARVKNILWAGSVSGVGLEFGALESHARRIIDGIVRSHAL